MKTLIDCSNLQVGGGIQVALSFLYDLSTFKDIDNTVIVLSPQIDSLINKNQFGKQFDFITVPSREHSKFWKRSRALNKIEQKTKPDVIFSVFGPSYNKSEVPKIVGYAIPHFIYENSPYFDLISLKEKINIFLLKKIKIYFFLKTSNYLVFETKDSRDIFCKKYNFCVNKTFVVSNRLNQIFLKDNLNKLPYQFSAKNKILCLSANYRHKYLEIIPRIIDILLSKGFEDFQFIISQNRSDLGFDEKYDKNIEYIGFVPLENLPSLYKSIDILFMPTLLEVFSTTYLEAMHMEVPIITSNLGFSRDVCGDAALYCEPMIPDDYADKIEQLFIDMNLREKLILKGRKNLKRFGTSMGRTQEYLEIINYIYKTKKSIKTNVQK